MDVELAKQGQEKGRGESFFPQDFWDPIIQTTAVYPRQDLWHLNVELE